MPELATSVHKIMAFSSEVVNQKFVTLNLRPQNFQILVATQ
jgi:hypothetical protein